MRRIPSALPPLLSLAALLPGCAAGGRCDPCARPVCTPCPPPDPTATLAAAAPAPSAADAARDANRARARGLLETARTRTAFLPLASEPAARAALPSMEGFPVVPNLIRIAAVLPKTTDAEMAAWEAMKHEGTIEKRLLSEVFYVVSSANACGHCMGHILFGTSLRGVPETQVLDLDLPSTWDPKRAATFSYARKLTRAPETITRADVDALRPWFTDAQIVELAYAVCRYSTMNRLAEAFGTPLETINVFDPKNATSPLPKPEPPADAKPPEPATPDPRTSEGKETRETPTRP